MKPAPDPSALKSDSADTSAGWEVVVVELREVGLADAHGVVRQARNNGVSVATVRAIVAYYRTRPGAWGPGALHWRIRQADDRQPANEGWPPVNRAFAAARAQEAAAAAAAQRSVSHAEQTRRLAQERAELAAREERYGAVLDVMDEAELASLTAETFRDNELLWRMFRAHGLASPMVREQLVEKLASREADAR